MPNLLHVYPLPSMVAPEELAGGMVVVIDVLRASTTIAYALEAGAREVLPCREVEEAEQQAAALPPGEALLGGERFGVRIHGFDLANSPAEYTPDRVAGKTIVFTTSNGTQAMAHARQARRILIGSFVNAGAVCKLLAAEEKIHLLCAGTHGHYSGDDILLAGMLLDRLQREGNVSYQLNEHAATAREYWLSSFAGSDGRVGDIPSPERLAEKLRGTAGGKGLVALDLDADILAAAQTDRFRRVPELDPQAFRIRLA